MDFVFPVSTGTSHFFRTGAQRNERPIFSRKTAPCRHACPLHIDIAMALELAAKGDFKAALALYLEENPLPGVTGRVCYHPCEASCNRASFDAPLSLRALERAIAEHDVAMEMPSPKGPRVAVIGSGPAGLACAFHLRRSGYAVTMFERHQQPGGMLRYAIPRYRLPRAVLDRELSRVFALGVELHLKTTPSPDDLKRFDAIFSAPGLPVAKRLFDGPSVATGLGFLADPAGVARKRVLVVGGGNVGIDVARTCVRLGAASVTLLSPEAEQEMPALPEEVREAREEGVELLCGYAPLRLVHEPRLVLQAGPVEVQQSPFRIVAKEGPEVSFEIDRLIAAIGQTAGEDAFLLGPQAFVGGDAAGTRPFVADALASGRDGAREIIAFFEGSTPKSNDAVDTAVVTFEALNTLFFVPAPRMEPPVLAPAIRVKDFAEVQGGLDVTHLSAELGRCFRCGTCIECDFCKDFCPDISIIQGRPFYTFDEEHCKGCGVCATACPRNVIDMQEEAQ